MPDEPAPSVEDHGLIDKGLTRVFGRSYRTTIAGFAAFACTLIPLIPGIPPPAVEICRAIAGIAAASGLIVAKDSRVSGPAT